MPPSAPPPPGERLRALTSIYAPRKPRPRKNRTAQALSMLQSEPPALAAFDPLPAIGQKATEEPEIFVLDLNKNLQKTTLRELTSHRELRRLAPLTYRKEPLPLLRENTYDVLRPVHAHPAPPAPSPGARPSPKTRFKNAAHRVAKLSPETGKLLCLREKETFRPREADRARSPPDKLDQLSELFQCLDMKGQHRRVKKENYWF